MVLGGVRWDKKEFPESNLHVCGKDNTKIVVYNMGRYTEKEIEKKKIKQLENETANSCVILWFNKTV